MDNTVCCRTVRMSMVCGTPPPAQEPQNLPCHGLISRLAFVVFQDNIQTSYLNSAYAILLTERPTTCFLLFNNNSDSDDDDDHVDDEMVMITCIVSQYV